MPIKPESLVLKLRQRFVELNPVGVSMLEAPPRPDPDSDYKVVVELKFEPESLSKCALELWITDEGYVCIGVERRERITARLGLRECRSEFVHGEERCDMNEEDVLRLLDEVASGRVSCSAIECMGFLNSAAISLDSRFGHQIRKSHLGELSAGLGLGSGHNLRYVPWSSVQ